MTSWDNPGTAITYLSVWNMTVCCKKQFHKRIRHNPVLHWQAQDCCRAVILSGYLLHRWHCRYQQQSRLPSYQLKFDEVKIGTINKKIYIRGRGTQQRGIQHNNRQNKNAEKYHAQHNHLIINVSLQRVIILSTVMIGVIFLLFCWVLLLWVSWSHVQFEWAVFLLEYAWQKTTKLSEIKKTGTSLIIS